MKQEILNRLNPLTSFLTEVEAINGNPYSAGLDTKRMITDLKAFTKDLIGVAEQLPEEAPDEIEKAESASEE